MATYRSSAAYDLSLFEPQVIEQPKKVQKNAPASKRVKKTVPKVQQKITTAVEVNGITQTVQRQSTNVKVNKLAKQLIVCAIVCCLSFFGLLVMESKCNALDKQIAAVESRIDIEEGEAVRLNAELSSKISSDKIENYAENVLGMVKAESYQISYIDLSEGDEIVVSGDKTVGGQDDLSGKIKQLFAYIF
jgi:hypothetical protein